MIASLLSRFDLNHITISHPILSTTFFQFFPKFPQFIPSSTPTPSLPVLPPHFLDKLLLFIFPTDYVLRHTLSLTLILPFFHTLSLRIHLMKTLLHQHDKKWPQKHSQQPKHLHTGINRNKNDDWQYIHFFSN